MAAVIYAFLGALGTLFRWRISMQVEIVALRHQLAVYQRRVRRPHLCPADRILWAWLSRHWATCFGLRAACDRHRLATETLTRSLDAHEPSREAGQTTGKRGDTRAHPYGLQWQSAVGYATHRWRAGKARYQSGEVDGGQVSCAIGEGAFTDVGGVLEESRQ